MSMEYYALHSPNEGSYKQKDVRLSIVVLFLIKFTCLTAQEKQLYTYFFDKTVSQVGYSTSEIPKGMQLVNDKARRKYSVTHW